MEKTEIVACVLADYLPMARPEAQVEMSKRILARLEFAEHMPKALEEADISRLPHA